MRLLGGGSNAATVQPIELLHHYLCLCGSSQSGSCVLSVSPSSTGKARGVCYPVGNTGRVNVK